MHAYMQKMKTNVCQTKLFDVFTFFSLFAKKSIRKTDGYEYISQNNVAKILKTMQT